MRLTVERIEGELLWGDNYLIINIILYLTLNYSKQINI